MAIHITGDTMTLKIGDRVVATARFSQHAAADGYGAWIAAPAMALCPTSPAPVESPPVP